MDLIGEDHSYLQYFNTTDPYMHTNNSEHLPITIQHGDNNTSHNSTSIYMNPTNNKQPNNNNKQQLINSSITQPYSPMSINSSLSSMNSGSIPMHSAQIMQQPQPPIDQNSMNNNHQARFCKSASVNTAPPQPQMNVNHYETPPTLSTYHQPNIANHHSPSPNHFNEISATITHISESDNSNNSHSANYATPPPSQTQPGMVKQVGKNNMVSTPQAYSSMGCHMSNDWNTMPSHISNTNSQRQRLKNSNTPNNNNNMNYNLNHSDDNQFSYMGPARTSEYLSITSTPVLQITKTDSFIVNNNHSKSLNITDHVPNNTTSNKMIKLDTINEIIENPSKSKSNNKKMAEKRHIIIFKIIEQLIDPETKNVIKENVTKNEEHVISMGLQDMVSSCYNCNSNQNNTTVNTSSNITIGSSGLLADISSLTQSTNSVGLQQQNSGQLSNSVIDEKCDVKPLPKSTDNSKHKSQNNNNNASKIKSNNNTETDNNEDKERGAASALLSLQTANTPVKNTDQPEFFNRSTTAEHSVKRSLSKSNENLKNNKDEEQTVHTERLKPGMKILAKWTDKNFYPAETVKQNETHKWMIRFEDNATRNLFESEIIHVEYLNGQEVMVKISEELFKISLVKKIIKKDNKHIEFDLEHFSEDEKTKVINRYPLKDILLYAEQGMNILSKFSRPQLIGAVFADVDLDNIVSGKRARSTKKNTNSEGNNIKTKSKSNQSISTSDISDNDCTSIKKRKLTNDKSMFIKNEDTSKQTNGKSSKNSSSTKSSTAKNFQVIGHYHENSLALSPCPSKSIASTIPKNELEKMFGPIPKAGSKLFQNLSFILTCGYNNNNVFQSEDSNPECSTPFDKSYLTKQIISGSGKVFDTFDEMKASSTNGSECICIADTYSRSIKFIQCLAAGVSIVSHQWIIECCRQNRTLDRNSYTLPAGFSIITNALSSDKNTFKRSSVLFKGMKFYFGSEVPEKLLSLWSSVLFAAQATIVPHDPNIHKTLQRGQIDIIIGDVSCPNVLVTKAKQFKIPIVSSEYIVQCLINGRKLSYDASPSFSYMQHKF